MLTRDNDAYDDNNNNKINNNNQYPLMVIPAFTFSNHFSLALGIGDAFWH